MGDERLTEEEHIARAMLMGRIYLKSDHTYFLRTTPNRKEIRLDADTLEPVSSYEAFNRYKRIKEGLKL